MSGKMPRFLITSIASLLLAACGVDTMEAIPNQIEEPTEVVETIESEDVESNDSVEIVEVDEETETEPIEADESASTEDIEKEAEVIANELQVKNKDQALNQLLLETHLEKDAYSFYFVETDSVDYVEIEVREIREDSEHATLEGAYRYIIETQEILMRDYLTGDFIPYEPIE